MIANHPRRGVSLTEVAICSVLVSAMVVASMNTMTATHLTHRLTAGESTGPGLAQELLSEVLAQAYMEPGENDPPLGPDVAEPTREFFDDVDDYHNYTGPVETREGVEIVDYTGWTRSVTVDWIKHDTKTHNKDEGLKLVTVTVTSDTGEVTELSGVRTVWGALEQPPAVDTEAVVWIGAALKTDASVPTIRTGVHLPNLLANPNAN